MVIPCGCDSDFQTIKVDGKIISTAITLHRFDLPLELGKNEDDLYLKAPFPRFEALDNPQGMSLVLSSAATDDPFLTKLKLREPSAPGGSEEVADSLFDPTVRLYFVPANGQSEAYKYMDVVFKDDTYARLTELRTKYKVPVAQTGYDTSRQVISHVTNTFMKQFGNIFNAARHSSPGDVLKEVAFKGAMMQVLAGLTLVFLGQSRWIFDEVGGNLVKRERASRYQCLPMP
ncbi:uncharacterized protein NECHADRAFT_86377 [Fusarium vanettenii 77-13-4]|uniref:Uncharacterized protein n=1 Tax=Fusarium vanettenii (strain ATCC MYA-4622 / CBS 123669 / FGSC 9596 / NRRL 45880 / 77-13-4) TaxID=660122 RepID=C7ZF36_FUSV7|nr:uncharacterized protein NECHADRAFT_86377 [Fusarium vanettenii 77-13-4]EEU37497.1 predicted protein [Fusarium vanettenii 77-13-4]